MSDEASSRWQDRLNAHNASGRVAALRQALDSLAAEDFAQGHTAEVDHLWRVCVESEEHLRTADPQLVTEKMLTSLAASIDNLINAVNSQTAGTKESGASFSWETLPSNFTVNCTGANVVGSITDYHNSNASPIDVFAAQNDASSTSQPLPQVTTAGNAETILHVVGYDLAVTPGGPSGDTARASVSSTLVSQILSDRYQSQSGPSASASANSNLATTSEAITVALKPAVSVDRMGYSEQGDTSTFTQDSSGHVTGTNVALPGGAAYVTTTASTAWSFSNLHGDVVATVDSNGNSTWTGYFGPYGEFASGTQPTDTSVPGANFGYNGSQGKLTDGDLVLMGVRPYQPDLGRFTQADPFEGGCANDYVYSFGDPINHPDLSGQGGCHKVHHSWWDDLGTAISIAGAVVGIAALTVTTGGVGTALAFGAVGLGAAGTVIDSVNCANHPDVVTCGDIVLGAAGVAGGVGALGKELADVGAPRAFGWAFGSTLGIAAGVTDGAASLAPRRRCDG